MDCGVGMPPNGSVQHEWRCRPLGTSNMGERKPPTALSKQERAPAVVSGEVRKSL